MNKENILKVADAIENSIIPDLGFDMDSFYDNEPEEHICGTTACIAGWTVLALSSKDLAEYARQHYCSFNWEDIAGKLLGLDSYDIDRLFIHTGYNTSPENAVKVLRNLAETGEVEWGIVNE